MAHGLRAQACAENEDKHDYLPLHLAAIWGASAGVVGRLLQQHPRAAAVETKDGDLPLHLALQHKASEGVALRIIDAHPQVRRHARRHAKS